MGYVSLQEGTTFFKRGVRCLLETFLIPEVGFWGVFFHDTILFVSGEGSFHEIEYEMVMTSYCVKPSPHPQHPQMKKNNA